MELLKLLLMLPAIFLFVHNACADAWPVPRGHAKLLLDNARSIATNHFDPYHPDYDSKESAKIEVAITDNLSAGYSYMRGEVLWRAAPSYHLHKTSEYSSLSLKYAHRFRNNVVIAIQPALHLRSNERVSFHPASLHIAKSPLNERLEPELRLLIGYNWRKYFADVEVAVRKMHDDRLLLLTDVTLGKHLRNFIMLNQFFLKYHLSQKQPVALVEPIYRAKLYNAESLAYHLTDDVALQLGVNSAIFPSKHSDVTLFSSFWIDL